MGDLEMKQYVNVGCGQRYLSDWINIDMVSSGPGVMAFDLTQGIPLNNESCQVVYNSHFLEHLRHKDALPFIGECYRVLKPGGILRVVVPDLEQISRAYLETLEAVTLSETENMHDYDWVVIELLDQCVCENRGGEMKQYLTQEHIPNEDSVIERIGEPARELRALANSRKSERSGRDVNLATNFDMRMRLGGLRLRVKRRLIKYMLGENNFRSLQLGRFRESGEVHQWMYDRYSLRRLFIRAGFSDICIQTARSSLIPGWIEFNLDTTTDGLIRRPNSLYMEAGKALSEI